MAHDIFVDLPVGIEKPHEFILISKPNSTPQGSPSV